MVTLALQVVLKIQHLRLHLLFWHSQALLELRDMEYIMHSGKMSRQLKLVGKISNSLCDTERSHKLWSQLASHVKSVCASKWRDLDTDKVILKELQISPPFIRTALLPALSNSNVLPHLLNFLFGLFDDIRFKE